MGRALGLLDRLPWVVWLCVWGIALLRVGSGDTGAGHIAVRAAVTG